VQFLDVARLYEVPSVLVGLSQNALQVTYVTFIDTNQLPVVERKRGWRGRYFDSPNMTFAHYEFDAGSSIHEHFHLEEEVWQIVEGELEITIDGVTKRVDPAPSESFHPTHDIRSRRSPAARRSSSTTHCASIRIGSCLCTASAWQARESRPVND